MLLYLFISIFASATSASPRPHVAFATPRRVTGALNPAYTQNKWRKVRLYYETKDRYEEMDEELKEAQEMAAVDAHDCNDPGMEAAMEERAVMLAKELAGKMKENQPEKKKKNSWNEEHLAHGASEIREETDDELRESEEAAVVDAHDCDDPGMESVMEERAVMLAREMAHKIKQEAKKKSKDAE